MKPFLKSLHCLAGICVRRASSESAPPLVDSFARQHNYLRVSLTDKCNLRCTYCMPAAGVKLEAPDKYLTGSEYERLVCLFVNACKVDKIRLTGGEPTVESNKLLGLLPVLNSLKLNASLKHVALTTNGLTLKRHSKVYKQMGVDLLNISIDTLKPEKYKLITRRDGFELAFAGLMQALQEGFDRVKVNCVLMKGVNDSEILDFVELAVRHPIEVRFIEFMPFLDNHWSAGKLVTYAQTLELIKTQYPSLRKAPHSYNATSKLYTCDSFKGQIGFISSMSDNFCADCNRLRLTADGSLKVCLFDKRELSLRDLMRNGASDAEILLAVRTQLTGKRKEHSRNLSHLNDSGELRMVDVTAKAPVARQATATGKIRVGAQVLTQIRSHTIAKGDIVCVAKVAALLAAKQTANIIPLCHQLELSSIDVCIEEDKVSQADLVVTVTVKTARHATGVEMEALVGTTTALLTIYDMCKSINGHMLIYDIRLVSKIKNTNTDC